MAAPPELSQLLALSRDRTAYQNPLFQAVTQMAYQGLPTYARQGTQLSGTLSNQAPPPSVSGGMNPALAAGLGAAGGAALNSLGPQGNAIGALVDWLKKKLGGGHGVQGNQPYGGGALTGPGFDNSFTGWADPSAQYGGWGAGDQGPTPNVTTSEDFSWPWGGGGFGDEGPQQSGSADETTGSGMDWWNE